MPKNNLYFMWIEWSKMGTEKHNFKCLKLQKNFKNLSSKENLPVICFLIGMTFPSKVTLLCFACKLFKDSNNQPESH